MDDILASVGGHGDAHPVNPAEAAASITLPPPASEPVKAKRKYTKQPGANPPGPRPRTEPATPRPVASAQRDKRSKDELAASEAQLKAQLAALQGNLPTPEAEKRAERLLQVSCATIEGVCYFLLDAPETAPTPKECEFVVETGKQPLAPYLGSLGPGVDLIPFVIALAGMGLGMAKRTKEAKLKKQVARPMQPPTPSPVAPTAPAPASDLHDSAGGKMVGPGVGIP